MTSCEVTAANFSCLVTRPKTSMDANASPTMISIPTSQQLRALGETRAQENAAHLPRAHLPRRRDRSRNTHGTGYEAYTVPPSATSFMREVSSSVEAEDGLTVVAPDSSFFHAYCTPLVPPPGQRVISVLQRLHVGDASGSSDDSCPLGGTKRSRAGAPLPHPEDAEKEYSMRQERAISELENLQGDAHALLRHSWLWQSLQYS